MKQNIIPWIKTQLIIRARAFQIARVKLFQKATSTKQHYYQGVIANMMITNFRETSNCLFRFKEDYQWKYVRPPVLGTWRKNSKSLRVLLSSLTSKSSAEDAHLKTLVSQWAKSSSTGEAYTELNTGKK